MSLFVTLYKFTDQGIRNVKESPTRLATAISVAEAMGVKMLGAYYTVGEYDLVVISETADESSAMAHLLATGALGNVHSMTMKAFTPAEFAEIVKKMP